MQFQRGKYGRETGEADQERSLGLGHLSMLHERSRSGLPRIRCRDSAYAEADRGPDVFVSSLLKKMICPT